MSDEGSPARRRLGFAVKVVGRPGMKDHDGRRWSNHPHLKVSLGYLTTIFAYLSEEEIRMYRMSSNIVPYATHPDLPQFHGQVNECREELAALGADARRRGLRLSMHPAQYIVLNSPDEQVAESAVREFTSHAAFLDAMGLPNDHKIVTHVGGVYGDREGARERFICRYQLLPDAVRRRLVLENDEVSWPVADTLRIHEATGVPLVFDNLHHAVNNRDGLSPREALRACAATWPAGEVAKIHFSSQRTAEREIVKRDRATGAHTVQIAPPKIGQHDDWVDAQEFVELVSGADRLQFDVMLEAKQKDLALLKLRSELHGRGLQDLAW